jgi:hypothetical protein
MVYPVRGSDKSHVVTRMMTEDGVEGKKDQKSGKTSPELSKKQLREQRLAEELRANLRRRKAQNRQRQQTSESGGNKTEASD